VLAFKDVKVGAADADPPGTDKRMVRRGAQGLAPFYAQAAWFGADESVSAGHGKSGLNAVAARDHSMVPV
jgi:hypothetical protein